jgi:hypothetical protein
MTPSLAAIDLLEDTWGPGRSRDTEISGQSIQPGAQRRMRSDLVHGIEYLPIRLDRVRA